MNLKDRKVKKQVQAKLVYEQVRRSRKVCGMSKSVLFVIYINDMPEVVSNMIQLFADDTKIFSQISSQEDHALLQEDLQHLEAWASKWQLRFNSTKCKVMHLGHSNLIV